MIVLVLTVLSAYSVHQQKKILQNFIEPKIDNNIEKLDHISLESQKQQQEMERLHHKMRDLQNQNEKILVQNEDMQQKAKEQNLEILSQREALEVPLRALKDEIKEVHEYFNKMSQNISKNFPKAVLTYETQMNDMAEKIDKYAKWGESKILESQKATLDSIDTVVRDFRESVKLIGACLDKIWNYLQNQEELLGDMQYSIEESTKTCNILFNEYESWQVDPLVRRSDLDRKDIIVFIDFENFLLSIWDENFKYLDYEKLRNFLVDPLDTGRSFKEQIIVFTNKSRWQRKDFYDKKKNITYQDALQIRQIFQENGARFIEAENNIDIPLAFLAMNFAKRRDIDEFILVANDGTYGALLRELSDLGCTVTGILFGDPSNDLVYSYKRMGFSYLNFRNIQEIGEFKIFLDIDDNEQQEETLAEHETEVNTKKILALMRKQGMQFLGAEIQDKILRFSHEILSQQGKMELTDLIQILMKEKFPNEVASGELSKTKINGVLAIIRRSGCVEITRDEKENSPVYWTLLDSAKEYKEFRKMHDSVFFKIAEENKIKYSDGSFLKYSDEDTDRNFSDGNF